MSTLVDAPARVDGVELIGEMAGSGYRTPPSLVRRGDGQVLQLTPLLYLVLSAVDGRRSCAEIAERVSQALGRLVSEDQVRSLVDGHLRPLGLLTRADGAEPELRRANPLLRLKPRFAVTDPRTTRRITDPFRVLFSPIVVTVCVLGFLAVVTWVFFERGLGASAYDAFERPHLLLLVFVVTVLSGGFHEFGHAAATRYSGAQPGAMGAGLYLVWPAFYTDVTDSYRLDRAGRIRTDLGGLYFNAIVVVLTFVWWAATGWEALLLLVATQVLQMTQQLLPLLRFDGYHVLADIAGVPDLYHRIKPTLTGLLPHRWKAPENRVLTTRARVLITLWVLVTVPMMALMLLGVVAAVPRLLGSAGSSVREDLDGVARAWTAGAGIDLAAQTLQVLGVVLPVLAAALVLSRVGTRFFGGLARWSRGSAGKRLVAILVSAMVVTGLSWAWWPHPGTYRPIQPGERGLVSALLPGSPTPPTDLARAAAVPGLSALPAGAAAQQRLSGDDPLVAAFPDDGELPTADEPDLAIVLVPADDPGAGPSGVASPTGAPSGAPDSGGTPSPSSIPGAAGSTPGPGAVPEDEPWVFPFDQPLPPEEGDNQALATNTTDNTAVYDVAFALVWAEGDEVLNVNEAHAYASCSDCVAVAVAFQVVLIMDDAQVVVPQNLAVAANYDCYQCITAALASQLVLTVEEVPGEEQLLALGAIWNQLLEFAATITSYSLTEIVDHLEEVKTEIAGIFGAAPLIDADATASPSPAPTSAGSGGGPTSTSTPDPTGTAGPTGEPSAGPTPGSTTGSTSEPTPSPSESPTEGSTPTAASSQPPSPEPTAGSSTPDPTAGSSSTTVSPSP